MENTDFVIEHIDEEVQVIADQPSVVTNYPANTDFFIENIDSNVISIAHSLNIEASEVDFRPANTDFFIENIDKNVIAIAESMSLTPSEVDFRPANTDFFVENIDKNLIEIAESLSLTPYEVTIRPANTDMFIENIDKNVTLIKGSTNVVTVSGEYININIPDGGKVQSAQIDGNATQTTYSGKNLWNNASPSAMSSSATWTPNDNGGVFKNPNTWATGLVWNFELDTTKQYTVQVSIPSNLQFFFYVRSYTDNTYSTESSRIVQEARGNISKTFQPDTQYVRLFFWNGSAIADGVTIRNMMFEQSASASTFEPYVGGIPAPNPEYPMPISVVTGENVVKVVGKNLCPISEIQNVGWATANTDFKNFLNSLPLGTYSISVTFTLTERNDTTDDSICGFVFQNAGGQIGSISGNTWGNAGIGETKTITNTFTINEAKLGNFSNALFYGCGNNSVGRTGYATISNIQVELGSTPTTYEPYQGQDYVIPFGDTYLAAIGDYADEPVKVGDTWYIRHAVGKVVLDGSEDGWVLANATTGYTRCNLTTLSSPETVGLCDTLTFRTGDHGAYEYIWFRKPSAGGGCFIQVATSRTSNVNGLAEFKAWLASHPTTVYYVLATPTTTEITNQTLIDQLEALASAALNQGVNNIFTEIATGNAMPTLKLVIEKY